MYVHLKYEGITNIDCDRCKKKMQVEIQGGFKSVLKFENKFSKYCGTKYAVGCGNGTDALFLALKSLNLPKNSVAICCASVALPPFPKSTILFPDFNAVDILSITS